MLRLTVDGWVASQSAEGLFPYGFDFLADQPLEPGRISPSNLIRQAGTTSALAAYYLHTRDPRLQEPLQRALAALRRHSLSIGKAPTQSWLERTRILSVPVGRWKLQAALERLGLLYETSGSGKVVSPDGTYESALAGTAALALLAEVLYAEASGDNRHADLRAAWRDALLGLRIPGGGFRRTPNSIDDSDYYNGEAWLALAVYADLHRDDAATAAALVDLDHAMIERYAQQPSRGFYHWGAMAAARRLATTRDPRFLEFLRGHTDLYFARLARGAAPGGNHCATMEGMAATLAALNQAGEGDSARARQIQKWLSAEAALLPKLQIRPGQVDMVLGGDARLRAPRMAEFPGAFLLGVHRPETRVDAAQHCVSAMLMIERDRLQLLPE